MKTLLSLETSKQLQEWGCYVNDKKIDQCWFKYRHIKNEINKWIVDDRDVPSPGDYTDSYLAYDLRDIICDGEMAKQFFGDNFSQEKETKSYKGHTLRMLRFIQQNKKEDAEKYLLEFCIFNPNNKK